MIHDLELKQGRYEQLKRIAQREVEEHAKCTREPKFTASEKP